MGTEEASYSCLTNIPGSSTQRLAHTRPSRITGIYVFLAGCMKGEIGAALASLWHTGRSPASGR